MATTTVNQTRKPRARTPVRIIVEREFVGGKTMTEALIPVITEDLRSKAEQIRTFDSEADSS